MKIIIVFVSYIVMIVAISIFFGCEGQPLNVLLEQSEKHSTDIVTEVADCYTGLAIDAEAGEYRAIFDKSCVDVVLGVSTDTVSVSEIVSDTAGGGSAYEGQLITLTGTVSEKLSSGETLLIETENNNVLFFVRSWGNAHRVTDFEVGESYTFSLYIQDQATSAGTDWSFNVWSDIVANAEPEAVTLDTLSSNAKTGDQQYAQRVITLKATVSNIIASAIYLSENDVNTSVYIRRSGHTDEADYQVNQSYDFTVFVFKTGEWVIDGFYEVRLGLVR